MDSIPRIEDSEPEEMKVQKLARQVGELLSKNRNFKTSMSAVLYHRYNGRFGPLYRKVASYLSQCRKPSTQPVTEQLSLSLGA